MTLHALRAIAAACLIIPLAGCGALQKAVDFVDAPKTQQAVFTLKVVTTALVCNISSGSALALSIERQINASGAKPIVHTGTTSLIAVSSSTVCAALQGSLTGQRVANVTAVTSVETIKN